MTIKKPLSLSIEDIFICIAAAVIVLFLISSIFAELNLFYYIDILWFFPLAYIAFSVFVLCIIFNKVRLIPSRTDILAIVLTLLFCVLNIIFFHQTFSGGRDDGVYANTALYLNKYNAVYIKDTNVASYPGFIETPKGIISQFYLGYISWIAMIIRFFGVAAISFVNFPLLLIGLLSIYYICKKIGGWKVGILTIILLSLSYPFLWFTRKTFSENLFFMLTWFGMLCLIKGIEKKNVKYFLLSIVSINLLSTVRVESIPLVLLLNPFLIFIFFKYRFKKYLFILLPVILISLLPAIYYYLYLDPRYIDVFRTQISSLITAISSKLNSHNGSSSSASIITNKNIIEYKQPQLVFTILQLYNFYFFILMIPIAIVNSFFNYSKKQRSYFLLIIVILLPNLFFLIKPEITFDQPWFLRRFMPVILPISIMCFCYVIQTLHKKIKFLIATLVIIASFLISAPIFAFKEYAGALDQANQNLQGTLSDTDLLLVDYENTGHYKLAEPLFFFTGIHTVAIEPFSIQKLFGKTVNNVGILYNQQAFQMDSKYLCTFKNLYTLTTTSDQNVLTDVVPQNEIIPIKDFQIQYDELINTCELFRLTDKATFEAMANVDYNAAKNYCVSPPKDMNTKILHLRLEKIDTSIFNEIKRNNCTKNA